MTQTFLPFGLIYITCLIAAFLFAVRLLRAAFSAKISGQIRRHPVIHSIWGCFAYVGVVVFLAILNPSMSTWWPLGWFERLSQRQILKERVQSAGGWDTVRRDCVSLVESHTNGFQFFFRETNGLPASIVALQPHLVEYGPKYGCVHFRIFGSHSTGGIIEPYLGLEVDTSTNDVGHKYGAGHEQGDWTFKKVAEGIYEIY